VKRKTRPKVFQLMARLLPQKCRVSSGGA